MAVLLFHPSVALASTILGSAQSFAVLGASTVTNTGPTTITGDLGLSPGTSITGAPTVIGTIHQTDAVALQAQNDERYAYNALALLPATVVESSTSLAGLTLTPGVYRFSSDALLSGAFTLDFQNQINALFVFQIGRALTTASSTSVTVINGTATDGIFWQVGSSATLGTSTTFAGNILALASITLDTSATIPCGRAFAQTGAVTMDTNVISTGCAAAAGGRTDFGSAAFSPVSSLAVATPEPGSFLLFGVSLAGILVKYSARKNKK